MASRVANRTNGGSTTTTSAVAPDPRRYTYHNNATGHYVRTRAVAPPPVRYTVESVRDKHGREQEVLTLEDTPDPPHAVNVPARVQPPPANPYASTSQARNDPYTGYEPAPKKRKSDAAGQPYGGYQPHPEYAKTSNPQPHRSYYQQPAVAGGSGQKRKHDEYARDYDRPSDKGKEKQVTKADAEGHFIVKIGDIVTDGASGIEYQIERLLGQGTFGKVVAAKTIRSNNPHISKVGSAVAVKIIRNVAKYQEAAKTEIRVLKKLLANNADGRKNCIRLKSDFEYYGHTCLVTELLSSSVFDFLKENAYEPFPLSHVQRFARDLLLSLQYVHQSRLIHTDLKPENILLLDNSADVVPSRKSKTRRLLRNTDICLIDFGSATFCDEYHASVVSTRHYRAPEIILCLGWSYPCDMWSIGCILVEFVTGEALFQTHENLEHLAMMEKVFGPMPPAMVAEARRHVGKEHADWFKFGGSGKKREWKLNFPQVSTQKQSKKYVTGMKTLREIIGTTDPAREAFYDLCRGLLTWEQRDRLTVDEALNHDFFRARISDEGSAGR
ncbi:serine/threonine protein kinase KNS1 [Sporobolomyces koalae]|uniref:serine/threonine protein kinase KNS1 n=1 Tax=Sporobolomyces koalae TaxID=500713 RepID=UPI0031811D9B